MNFIKTLGLSFVIIFMSACSYPTLRYNMEATNTDFNGLVQRLVDKSKNQLFPHFEEDEVLVVPNFVDSQTLRGETELSFLLTEALKDKLVARHSYTIKEVELSKVFKLGSEGLKVLTRDVNSIKTTKLKKIRYAVVGTYTLTKNQLYLFLKLINLKNGNVLATSTVSTDKTQEIQNAYNTVIAKEPKVSQPTNIYQPLTL